MDARRFATGTLVGALTLAAAGYAMFGILLPDFFTQFMKAGPATGVERQPLLLWAIALAMLSYGALITFAITSNARCVSVGAGMKTGAVVSFLLWFTADFMLYGISNVGNVFGTVVDPFLELVPGAIAGGVITSVLNISGRSIPRENVKRDAA